MQQYRLNGYDISQVGPRVNPDYPIYRAGSLEPAIPTDDWDEFRNNFAGGMLNGYQIIPKQKPSYAGMLGTAENQQMQMDGLLGNVSTGQENVDPAAPVSQVVATQPTDTWVATPTDPNAPEAPVETGTGLTNAEYLQMMGVPVEFFAEGQPGVQALSKHQAGAWTDVMGGYGFDPGTYGSAITSWQDFANADAGDRSQAKKILDISRENQRGNMYENDPRLTANGMRMGN